jgi:choline dehydrogenase
VSVCNLRPESRGTSHLRSTNPAEQPDIRLGYLSAERDKLVAVKAVQQARALMRMPAMAKYAPEEFLPGPSCETDADLLRGVGDIASTIFHPVGTTRMGSDSMAVVDAELRVHGIDGLRVVDAGVMPTITSGNTASPTVMIAEKAAAFIRG